MHSIRVHSIYMIYIYILCTPMESLSSEGFKNEYLPIGGGIEAIK